MPEHQVPMSVEVHQQRHIDLHKALDELLADYLTHNKGSLPSRITVLELIVWSFEQTKNPTGTR